MLIEFGQGVDVNAIDTLPFEVFQDRPLVEHTWLISLSLSLMQEPDLPMPMEPEIAKTLGAPAEEKA